MQFLVLSTGSCGNSYLFYERGEAILVDMGVTMTKLKRTLELHGIPLFAVKALLLTHLHPDHTRGVGAFSRSTECPIYLSSAALNLGTQEMKAQKIAKERITSFSFGSSFSVGGFSITPFKTSHDSPGSSGYYISNGDSRIFLMTDTGVIPEEAYKYSSMSNLKFIEANYDDDMLINGPYKDWLKKRVGGPYGHLSNADAVNFAKNTSQKGDRVFFVHLSDNNNDYDIVKDLAERSIDSSIFLCPLKRGESYEGYLNEE